MKASLLIAITFFSFSVKSIAQGYEWVTPLPYVQYTSFDGAGLQMEVSGESILFCGVSPPFVDWGSTYFGDLLLSWVNDTGAITDSVRFVGQGLCHDLIVHDEGYYISGHFKNALQLDTFSIETFNDDIHPFLAKLDLSGVVISVWDLYDELGIIELPHIALTENGSLLLEFTDWGGSGSLYTVDEDLVIESFWPQDISFISSLEAGSNGNVFFSGGCVDQFYSFNGTVVESPFEYTTIIGKYDEAGNLVYARLLEDVTCSISHVLPTGSGDLYVVWTPVIEQTFDGQDIHGPEWVYSFIVMKLDALGELIWLREFAADDGIEGVTGDASFGSIRPAVVRSDGGLTLTGSYRYSMDWGNGFSSENTSNGPDLFILGMDADGAIDFVESPEEDGNYLDTKSLRIINEVDHYILLNSSLDLVLGEFEIAVEPPQLFLTKWSSEANGIEEQPVTSLRVYPDPASDEFSISGLEHPALLRMYDMQGRLALESPVNPSSPRLILTGLNAGSYVLELIQDGAIILHHTIRVLR